MNAPQAYGVYLARIPFLDIEITKIRPVIAISLPYGKYNVVAIIPVSSILEHERADLVLGEWKEAGLLKPSVARVHRLTTLLQGDLLSQLGFLKSADVLGLQNALRVFLRL